MGLTYESFGGKEGKKLPRREARQRPPKQRLDWVQHSEPPILTLGGNIRVRANGSKPSADSVLQ